MRSTIAPEISAAVMIANVPWKAMNSTCGISTSPLRLEPDAAQEEVRGVADPVVAGGERQRVAEHRPQHADESQRDEAHHHRVERVLRADQAAVEEGQRRRHQQHQRGGDQHPGGVGPTELLVAPAPPRSPEHPSRTTSLPRRPPMREPACSYSCALTPGLKMTCCRALSRASSRPARPCGCCSCARPAARTPARRRSRRSAPRG